MNNKNLLYRFYEYQKERFPFAILIFTTFSVVLSSAAIVRSQGEGVSNIVAPIIIGTVVSLLFMFNIRVFDDYKDKKFDNRFHKNRPVQRGLISLKELNILNIISIVIQIVVGVFASLYAFFYWLLSMAYSLLARKDFFIGKYLKKKFMLYNFLNLMQIFFLQIHLYALIEPGFSFKDFLLFVHFIFVLANAQILEVARKLKGKKDESKGLDTYSSRYGIKKSVYLYLGSIFLSYFLFMIILYRVNFSINIIILSLVSLVLIVYSVYYYILKRNRLSTKIIEAIAILFYLSMHLLIAGAAFL